MSGKRGWCFLFLAWWTTAQAAWVDGTVLLRQQWGLFGEGFPLFSVPPRWGAPARFNVGHQRDFFAFDFEAKRQYVVGATLRAVGDFCYIYVADDQWNTRVGRNDVAGLLDAFEHRTPTDSRQGIYQIVTNAFGDPPDIDGDPRIVLLLLDIRDGYRPGGTFIAGYFSDVNELRGVVRDRRLGVQFQSNETEMLYLDTNPALSSLSFLAGILAHEFQHLIHYGLDPQEEIWVNEGCSELAMFLCGYPPTEHVHRFESEPTVSLTQWPSGMGSALPYYGSAYLWMLYLYERYGGLTTIRSLVQSRDTGIGGVEAALRGWGGFQEIFRNWRAALIADDLTYGDGRFGFENVDLLIERTRHRSYPVSTTTRSLSSWSGEALSFESTGVSLLQVEVDGSASSSGVWLVQALFFAGNRLVEVREMVPHISTSRFSEAWKGFGDLYDEVVLSVVYASSVGGEVTYDYAARLGAPVTFRLAAFHNPIQREYIEVVAVPDVPVEVGEVLLRLQREETSLEVPMRSANNGKAFSATFRAEKAFGDWEWELLHYGQPVGKGMFSLSP